MLVRLFDLYNASVTIYNFYNIPQYIMFKGHQKTDSYKAKKQ